MIEDSELFMALSKYVLMAGNINIFNYTAIIINFNT